FRILVPLPTLERTPTGLRPDAAPLLEEERNLLRLALVANIQRPCLRHWASAGTAFAAQNRPSDAGQVHLADRADQWLERDKLHGGVCGLKMFDAHGVLPVLDRHAEPNIRWRLTGRITLFQVPRQERTSL